MMLTKQQIEAIEKMIVLQEELNKKKLLSEAQQAELASLRKKYQAYSDEDVAKMRLKLRQVTEAPQKVNVNAEHDCLHGIIEEYKKRYGNEEWYKEPQTQEDKVNGRYTAELFFPLEEDAIKFMRAMAAQGHKFIVYTLKERQVLAYSNGDGTLYNSNEEPFTQTDKFVALKPLKTVEEIEKIVYPENYSSFQP